MHCLRQVLCVVYIFVVVVDRLIVVSVLHNKVALTDVNTSLHNILTTKFGQKVEYQTKH